MPTSTVDLERLLKLRLVVARFEEVPIENKRNFLDVSADIMEQVDPIFYGDPKTAAMKVLGG